ncbi:MAG: hypothetical protein GX552_12745, partial [Chloroflexi bacterium]|nr:hypothetical protein [Chloroflexota bacterium]
GGIAGLILGTLVGAALLSRYMTQEGHITVTIRPDSPGEVHYVPGECINGFVELMPEDTLKIQGGKMYLVCQGVYTYDQLPENEGDEPEYRQEAHQYSTSEVDIVPAGIVRRGVLQRYPFSFPIPQDALPTHHGYICAIQWTLDVVVDAPDLPPIDAHREIVVEAPPPALLTNPEGYQSATSSQACQLLLHLPRAVYAEGEQVSGRLHVIPSEDMQVQEISVVLLRVENTLKGDDHFVYVSGWDAESGMFRGQRRAGGQGTSYVWVESERPVIGPLEIESGKSVTHPFTVDLPSECRPTFSTKEGRVTWKVGVVVTQPDQPDIRAFHEIIVHTGPPQMAEMFDPEARLAANDAL